MNASFTIGHPRLMSVVLGLSAAVALLALRLNPLIDEKLAEFELVTFDYRTQTRPEVPLREDLLLVGLTDFDLDNYHRELRDRHFHALLMDALKNLGVASVLFDIVFVDEERQDYELAFEMWQMPTYLPFHFYIDQRYPSWDFIEERRELISDSWYLPYDPNTMGGELGEGHEARELKLPSPTLVEPSSSEAGLGFINVFPDTDGVVREIPLLIRYRHATLGDNLYPSLSLVHVLDRLGVSMQDLRVRFGEAIEFEHGDPPVTTHIPINEHGEMLVNFRQGSTFTRGGLSGGTMMTIAGDLHRWLSIPVAEREPLESFDVEGHVVPRELFEGATVLIGEIAVASTDIRATSIDRALPMITVHANAINSILNRDFIHRMAPWVEPALMLLFGLVAGFAFGRMGYMRSFLIAMLFTALHVGGAWLAFAWWSVWLPLVMPMMTMLVGGVAILLFHLLIEDKRRAHIRGAFEAYTSPEVVDAILENLDDPALWGAKRRVTSLFVDIRGFTTLTEKRTPEDIVSLLNDFYQTVVEVIQRHGGIPNKFIGDEIMALFNAPREIERPEEAACRTAIDIQLAIARLNETQLKPRLGMGISVGVGVNTGEVIVGIVGRKRIEYTALGDDVNIASRLQTTAKPGQVLIGEATHEALAAGSQEFLQTAVEQVRHLPEIVLKGMTRRFSVYELCYTKPNPN